MRKHFKGLIVVLSLVILPSVCYGKEMYFDGTVPINKEWNIKFSKGVDKQFIKNNIYVTNDSDETVTSDAYVDEDNTVVKVKSPVEKYKYNSNYKLNILSDVVSEKGKKLKEPVSFYFKTIDAPNVDMNTNNHFVSSYNKESYSEVNIVDGKISIKGKIDKRYDRLRVLLSYVHSDSNPYAICDKIPVKDGEFEKKFSDEIKDGDYILQLDGEQDNVLGSSNDMIAFIKLKKDANHELSFVLPPVYKHNYNIYEEFSNNHCEKYISSSYSSRSDDEDIIALAKEITLGEKNDYEKLRKIHDWVIDNIEYDREGIALHRSIDTDAVGVLHNRKTVCQGYANITAALLRACGIEARKVSGYASYNKYFDAVHGNYIGHAWDEAFVDGRWVILDTTWDAKCKDENGQVYAESTHYYFDPSIETFSVDHQIMEYNDWD